MKNNPICTEDKSIMNIYQQQLEKQLFQCSLVIRKSTEHSSINMYVSLNRKKLHNIAQSQSIFVILDGSINGFRTRELGLIGKTLKYLDDNIDNMLTQNKLVPELYVIGGYYPRKDHFDVFEVQHGSNGILNIWAKKPWTDMPVYQITNDKLIRVKEGEIRSPKTVTINEQLHLQLMNSLTIRCPFT